MARKMVPYDGNSAVAHVAHAVNEVMTIYPITPSSDMGEICDIKSAKGETNIWNSVPKVYEMQSEAGAIAAVHGALCQGSLCTTFTASQGLLLMIPTMHKIAGELMSCVINVAARSIACQALSIFGDHSDVMDVRATGFALLSSASVQEAMDMALISQAATLESRIPFIHFFEGFRISHEIKKIEELTKDDMRAMIDDKLIQAHRDRGMNSEHPTIRGTAQNPDVYFQGRETVNKYYNECPNIVQKTMDKFAKIVGRQYNLFDYVGHPEADRVIVCLGSGSEVAEETVEHLNNNGEKVGVIKVRLYRPFHTDSFLKALPKTVKKISVLDRTKEPGALGEPLYQEVITALNEARAEGKLKCEEMPVVVGGRYGLGSKEFTPAMAKAVFDNLSEDDPKNHFTVGIVDDVTKTSLDYDASFHIEGDVYRAMFYGLGADGTVGANKNSIKIIASTTDHNAQGYFVYDSKKAGSMTISHLRFGKKPIRKPYLISCANFLACHKFSFLEKYNMLKNLENGGTFLLNSPYSSEEVWNHIPYEVQKQIIDRKAKFYVINAIEIAEQLGLGARINVIMQTAFFKISGVMDDKLALNEIEQSIRKTYGKKGDKIVNMNVDAMKEAVSKIHEVKYPDQATSSIHMKPPVPDSAPEFVKNVTSILLRQEGDDVTVSQMPNDGVWPLGTTKYEKRNVADHIPEWGPEACIQCGVCSAVCPHAAIRIKLYDPNILDNAPAKMKSVDARGGADIKGMKCTIQIAPEDCTGCGTCVHSCPKKAEGALKMVPQIPIREQEAKNFDFFLNIPETKSGLVKRDTIKGSQLIRPLFEFSGACAGCGETAYVKLLTQLYGDRLIMSNATGCSSIYGGNLPTTPYCTREDGRGPAWNNSLFEDNAEVAFGLRLSVDKMRDYAFELGAVVANETSELKGLIEEIKGHDQSTQDAIENLRVKIDELKGKLKGIDGDSAKRLSNHADYFVNRSVWAMGGDGWAYDIGYGGLDHVMASGMNVNVLVMDTEVYSNTGGQASKATPLGAVAKFAAGGKPTPKKDLGLMMMSYGNVYVAQVAMGANPNHVVKAFAEAGAYNGPSIIISYAHCINHGIDMTKGLDEHKLAVNSGHWLLYRYNPDLAKEGKNPLKLDCKEPSIDIADFVGKENRYRQLMKSNPKASEMLIGEARKNIKRKWNLYKTLSEMDYSK
ncbi:pyruvate:ferredoxin (flavodoxin) oxidoreductase [bacterium]|nr:pyruvate:ferredoxin (flavodoxin) oxidoreductase [bacterium]